MQIFYIWSFKPIFAIKSYTIWGRIRIRTRIRTRIRIQNSWFSLRGFQIQIRNFLFFIQNTGAWDALSTTSKDKCVPVELPDERVEGLAGAERVDAQLGGQDLQALVQVLVPHRQEVQLDQSEKNI